jgi:2-hydroxychromene-2-carboxylate isomerase
MKLIVAAAFTLGALVLGTGVAHADPASFNSYEQAYLRELHNDDIPVSDEQSTVAVGHDVCNLLASGGTKEMAMNALPSNLDMAQRRTIVGASATYLCPM